MTNQIKSLFSIDVRSLVLFRIGLGGTLLWDLILRAGDVKAFYSDHGVLPRSALLENFSQLGNISLYFINGTTLYAGLLFMVAAVAALALMVGYKTRFATILSWLLLISLHNRNTVVLQGGDTLLRMLLFWSMFLPLGIACSADNGFKLNAKHTSSGSSYNFFSAGTVAILLQVCFMYWFTVALKTGDSWWSEASAVYYALSLDTFATPFGRYLLQFPEILKWITHGTVWIEFFGPIFAFSPFFNGVVRTIVVFTMIGFHLGLALTMNLGLFPYICILAWLPFLPGWFWALIPPLKVRGGQGEL